MTLERSCLYFKIELAKENNNVRAVRVVIFLFFRTRIIRLFDQENRPHDGVFNIVRHVRITISPVLGHPGSVVGAARGVVERHHVRPELHRRHIVLRENCTQR